jgi:hypothetical protein
VNWEVNVVVGNVPAAYDSDMSEEEKIARRLKID